MTPPADADRPRPQFGEYATPEEQLRARGLPVSPEPVAAAEPPAAPTQGKASHEGSKTPAPALRTDRILTIAFLAYGLYTVVTQGLAYLNLPLLLIQTMERVGIAGEFTNYGPARVWGTVAALVLALGWSLTAWFAVRRLRRRLRTWWVPLVGALATFAVVLVCIAIPLLGDPAFLAAAADPSLLR